VAVSGISSLVTFGVGPPLDYPDQQMQRLSELVIM
jgi:hypothetical protein